MDMPPADIQSPPAQVKVIDVWTGEQAYKYYILDRIDGPDIPDHVRQFAKEHNCKEIMKSYYWSYKLFKDNGGVYDCNMNGKVQYIYDNNDRMRFARWYEKRKFTKQIFGD